VKREQQGRTSGIFCRTCRCIDFLVKDGAILGQIRMLVVVMVRVVLMGMASIALATFNTRELAGTD